VLTPSKRIKILDTDAQTPQYQSPPANLNSELQPTPPQQQRISVDLTKVLDHTPSPQAKAAAQLFWKSLGDIVAKPPGPGDGSNTNPITLGDSL